MQSNEDFNGAGIYAFFNKVDGKVYVGQSKNVKTRKVQHERGDTTNSRRFHNAMIKHGPDGFRWTVLEICTQESLNEREAYWVNKLESLYPNGYNLTSGGGAFQKHHPETIEKFSQNQKKRAAAGDHIFVSPEFIALQSQRQKSLASVGQHPSQKKEVKAKRAETVKARIEKNGKFFSHTPEEIERKRQHQVDLYASGKGKFTQREFIWNNISLVQQKLDQGTHHTQQAGWTAKVQEAHKHQMKAIVLAIRTLEGQTIEVKYDSLHQAERELNADRAHISAICNNVEGVISINCSLGKIIRGAIGVCADWDISDLQKIPDSAFTRKISIKVTVKKFDESVLELVFAGQREACRELDAHHRAVRYMIKGEKYKSTSCKLGRIIKVEEVE